MRYFSLLRSSWVRFAAMKLRHAFAVKIHRECRGFVCDRMPHTMPRMVPSSLAGRMIMPLEIYSDVG